MAFTLKTPTKALQILLSLLLSLLFTTTVTTIMLPKAAINRFYISVKKRERSKEN